MNDGDSQPANSDTAKRVCDCVIVFSSKVTTECQFIVYNIIIFGCIELSEEPTSFTTSRLQGTANITVKFIAYFGNNNSLLKNTS
jgi:hypothetical protein